MQGPGHRRQKRGRRTVRMLESALLLLLHRETAHGYTLLEQLEEFDLGGSDSSATYRALRDMEARGWVTSTWDEEQSQGPPRRVYRITALGNEMLAEWMQDLDETRKALGRLVGAYHLHMEEAEGEHH